MNRQAKYFFIIPFMMLGITLAACQFLPGSNAEDAIEAAQTFAVETIVAELTEMAENPDEEIDLLAAADEQEEPTPEPEATIPPTATSLPCNQVSFVSDVTIPDQTQITVGESFTKTWRLRNTGSCTWTSGYELVFNSGDQMSGVHSKQLTAVTVQPNDTLDVSVDLVAPELAGTYQGFWFLKEPGGETFAPQSGPFWVEIIAVAPTTTPVVLIPIPISHTMTASIIAEESGSVRSSGQVLTPRNVGDTNVNFGSQAFLSFDISEIPAGATITSVEVDFRKYDTLGDPFSLGCLRMYQQEYDTLSSSDWVAGNPLGAAGRWCGTDELDEIQEGSERLIADLQSYVGETRAKFRLQFNEMLTNGNGISDMVRFSADNVLIISYSWP